MSLRQAFKSKFRSDKPDAEKEENMVSPPIIPTYIDDLEHTIDDVIDECPHPEQDCATDSCSVCYESQLAQLQEQLVAVMLENQQLVNEIKDLKDQTAIDNILKQLEKEKERSRSLSEKLHEKENSSLTSKSPRLRRFVRKEKHIAEKAKFSETGESSGMTIILEKDDNCEATKEFVDEDKEGGSTDSLIHLDSEIIPEVDLSYFGKIRLWMWRKISDFLEDFSETNIEDEDSTEVDNEGSPLTVKQLKENLVRFTVATKPVSNFLKNIVSLLRWNSPGTTLLAFCVYMYTVYHGWLLPLFIFLALCQLILNYIKGWFSPSHFSRKIHDDADMGVSDKFQLVLHVARKVQNQLGHMADCLEKIKNLLLWQQPEITAHFFFILTTGFVASCVFPANQLFTIAGFYLGVKLFIIDYIFYRFPRVQEKHDTTARMWRNLPTDAILAKKHNRAELDKLLVNQTGICSTNLTTENQNFCELFNLPPSESPLPSWHAGRRCTLINKDKSLTAAFKNGRLYLTNSFLCFERSKSSTPKNLVLPLRNISKVEKAKPYPWLPGGGMAIEVTLEKSEKTYIFGAILNRDETLESIIEAGNKAGLMWATFSHECEEPLTSTPPSTKKNINVQ